MKGSRKSGGPLELTSWLETETEEWTPTYKGIPGEIKEALRRVMIEEQRGLCVYCGRRLSLDRPGKSYHIEHFRPQHDYPDQQVTYANLFLSCGQEDENGLPAPTCGSAKAGWFDEQRHIYPAYSICTARFRFFLNGGIVAAATGDEAAVEMIARLKLDHPELKKDREDVLFQIDAGEVDVDDFWEPSTGLASSYAHVAFQYEGREIP